MADDSPGWKEIFAYVCFALAALLILLGVIRLIYWCYMESKEKKTKQNIQNMMDRYRETPTVKNNSYVNGTIERDARNLHLEKGIIYSEPQRPASITDSSYINPAVLYEDGRPKSTTIEEDPYETLERTMNIGQSGVSTPESRRSNGPSIHTARSLSMSYDKASALAALDHATAGETSVGNTPRSMENQVYVVSGDSGSTVVPKHLSNVTETQATYSYRYKTYSHEPLPDAREIEYTFATSTH